MDVQEKNMYRISYNFLRRINEIKKCFLELILKIDGNKKMKKYLEALDHAWSILDWKSAFY